MKMEFLVIEPGLGNSLFVRRVTHDFLKEILPKTNNILITGFIEGAEVGEYNQILGAEKQIVIVRVQ